VVDRRSLPVGKLLRIGPATRAKMSSLSVYTGPTCELRRWSSCKPTLAKRRALSAIGRIRSFRWRLSRRRAARLSRA